MCTKILFVHKKRILSVEFFTDEITDICIDLDFDMKHIQKENVCEAHYRFDILNDILI